MHAPRPAACQWKSEDSLCNLSSFYHVGPGDRIQVVLFLQAILLVPVSVFLNLSFYTCVHMLWGYVARRGSCPPLMVLRLV